MKTSISSDVWEKKKALIAKLYMEEEWPLKQVIKQIRSDDFNPSETQLRSRLKKWRVTKPSRQTRKKPQGSTSGDESERDGKSVSSVSSRSHRSPASKPRSISRSDWTAHPAYAPSDVHSVDQKWNAPLAQQLTPTLSGEHVLVSDRHLHSFPDHSPTTASFEQPGHTSPVPDGLMVSTSSAVTPAYAAYPLSPDSCFPSPGSSTTPALAQWPPRSVSVDMNLNPALHPGHWYHMPFEPITPPSGVPHSATPVYRDHMPMVASHGVYPHEYAHYNEAPEYHGYDPKPWKRTMSLQYDYHRRSEHERKSVPSHSHPPTMVPLPSSQPAGPHAAMCAPLMPYMGQDPMAQKPPGVGY
ncbi:hypothetical protein N7448_002131 [Penicillium atrosanguineum]|uniref:Clr5 domain-containing protein n=1 Tax=Penicillium atrosanguineum TaxID=1132637 RepID=A0A9W9PVB6_9EURO|nr:Meiotic recombination protein dmc1 [Penicillium atrosanguineum]KAJ5128412.1 hypothetical protein N7526_006578 [Penicillium atrosanguineum]KAJ5144739.1 hypothetical protein N7448_002131 [Penicillium atrosanguineum]KAJ5300531.1 Meiotic recombination protein dmc1 [Penicillium atrosanguineum]KAJ5311174.1 hypothetical protein N7476_007034 [Penicillium atrosanguineum]